MKDTDDGLEGYLEKYGPGYLRKYLAASREHGFSPSDLRGIVRYLLVNGHIELNNNHLILMGNTDFYLGADHIPTWYRRLVEGGGFELREDVHERLLKAASETDRTDWNLDDDFEMEHKELLGTKIEGVHLQNGRVNSIKIGETRIVEVYQTYDVPIDVPLFDEIELDCPDCAGILEVLETPHPKGWTHLCKGDCGGYHAPYGKDYTNVEF